ncbi:MAG: pentapeptide repeat-containing protein [Alphaproteobacteria bacterium]|nr:MAG: pentapeptide repeat-containing protein [Alphaproteobacteria bacterium]
MPAPMTTPAPWPVFSICRILQGGNFRAANFSAANLQAVNLQGAIVSHARTAGLRIALGDARAISAPGRSAAAHASRAYAPRPRRWPC